MFLIIMFLVTSKIGKLNVLCVFYSCSFSSSVTLGPSLPPPLPLILSLFLFSSPSLPSILPKSLKVVEFGVVSQLENYLSELAFMQTGLKSFRGAPAGDTTCEIATSCSNGTCFVTRISPNICFSCCNVPSNYIVSSIYDASLF